MNYSFTVNFSTYIFDLRKSGCSLFSYVGGPGLHDPCEKEPIDTLSAMTDEESEAITYNAQVCQSM